MLTSATFVNNAFEPGWPILADDVPLGKRYVIDLTSIRTCRVVNEALGRDKQIEVVWVVSPGPPGWLPLEAFRVDES